VGIARRTGRRAPWWLWVAPAAAVAVGVYLLSWAGRWPHSDVRNAGAVLTGVGVLAVGAVAAGCCAAGFATTWWRRVLMLVPTGLAVMVGLFALATVSADQQAACGTELAACSALLPGL